VKINVKILITLISMTVVLIIGLLISQKFINQRQIKTVFLEDKYNFNEQVSKLLLQRFNPSDSVAGNEPAKTINDVFNPKTMLYIAVLDNQDRLIHLIPATMEEFFAVENIKVPSENSINEVHAKGIDLIAMTTKIVDNNDRFWGTLQIAYPAKPMQKLLDSQFWTFLIFLLLFVGTWFVVLLYQTNTGLKPLNRLVNTLNELQAEWPVPIEKFQQRLSDDVVINKTKEMRVLLHVIKDSLVKIYEYEKTARENEKLAAIGQTTSMLAHDVRKPFSSVKSFLSMLPTMRFNDAFVEASAKDIDKALRTVENMIEDILEFSRTRELMLENCNPQTLITSSIVESVRSCRVEKDAIDFQYSFNHSHSTMIDTHKVIRVFLNIIGNAIEALRGEGKIWFATEEMTEKKMIQFTVGNNGPIIPHDKLQFIFDSFFTSGKKKGTGLGLAIAKKVVQEHGGDISVSSSTKEGKNITEFLFTLPVGDQSGNAGPDELSPNTKKVREFIESETKAHKNVPDNIKRNKEYCTRLGRVINIAIVDDEPIFRNNLRNTIVMDDDLKHLTNVIELSSGESALDLFRTMPVDFAIIDIDMGTGMNGLELAQIICQSYKNINYVIHSNRTASEYKEKAQQAGALAFIPKPMTYETLVSFLGMSGDGK
jgi:signal transduction histidine kinase/CheY-like chemotaxis protein